MRIQRVSENQIKFTLTTSDLLQRNIQIHELAYGSPKAQGLFREIMSQAASECDFHTSPNTPLIIEAIPTEDGIMVIVTRLESISDMEERFGYPPILGQLKKISMGFPDVPPPITLPFIPQVEPFIPKQKPYVGKKNNKISIFIFENLDQTAAACLRIFGAYKGNSSLYKYKGEYHLAISTSNKKLSQSHENILKEYSLKSSTQEMSKNYLVEHGEEIIPKNAVNLLASYLG
ncbi:MAG: adaptor protein MecA [Defluviitaleaceae bacterium]|nr:adaptor protein MecA [Defluviitaleaceae bacterium]